MREVARSARPWALLTCHVEDCHHASITPETIITPWYGERLDLDYAIYTCLANAGYQARQRDQAGQPGHHAAAVSEPAARL